MDAEIKPPPNVLLAGIVGSTAYGLAHEDSDIDRIGAYAAPTIAFHGLHPPLGKAATWVSSKPDATFHEAAKLAALLLKCNPTVTELLWLDEWEMTTVHGWLLVTIRTSFLSGPAVRNAYLGYATQQFRRLANRGDGSFSADTRKRTAKHARHLWRLIQQGTDLHLRGQLNVRLSLTQADTCKAFGETVATTGADAARDVLAHAEEAFDKPGVLPDRPDEAAAEKWLQDVRLAYWDLT
jgi:predicted nucleotidyltransferase